MGNMIWHYITITDREYDMQMEDDKCFLVHVYYVYYYYFTSPVAIYFSAVMRQL